MTKAQLGGGARGTLRALSQQNKILGVAVSGGSDSMGLLHLLQRHTGECPKLHVVTIDHHLRPESGHEAKMVAEFCASLDIPHSTLDWTDWDGTGNLQDAARRARYRLMVKWAHSRQIQDIALGHTADDNAETFLLGLSRGAGLDGLSGMRRRFLRQGVTFHRLILDQRRTALQEMLRKQGIAWVSDPSNEDPHFDRVKARQALAEMGIDVAQIGKSIANLNATRMGIEAELRKWARKSITLDRGDLLFDRVIFFVLSPEFRRRILNAVLRWVSVNDYPPRAEQVQQLMAGMARKSFSRTLHGCLISLTDGMVRITREYQAVRNAACPVDEIWDGRWRVTGPVTPGLQVRALGEAGILLCSDWRQAGLPRSSLLASPAVWDGDELVAAPLAGLPNGWSADLACDHNDFVSSLLSH